MAAEMSNSTVLMDNKWHCTTKMVVIVFVISWGIIAYAYAGSIMGTTLGR